MTLTQLDQKQKLKSYWNRPGGKFGTIVALAGLGALAYYVIPILTTMVWNTLEFGVALVLLGLFIGAVTNRKLRLSVFYFYEIAMKSLVGLVWKIDPFIIAEDVIKDMHKDRETLKRRIQDTDGKREAARATIADKELLIKKELSLAKTARAAGQTMAAVNAERQIGRYEEFVRQMRPIADLLDMVVARMKKVYESSKYTIEDAENELSVKKEMYKALTSGKQAAQSALKIFNGDPEKKLLAMQSMDALKDDLAQTMSQMRMAMEETDDFVNRIDLENATYEQMGLERLRAVEERMHISSVVPQEAAASGHIHLITAKG